MSGHLIQWIGWWLSYFEINWWISVHLRTESYIAHPLGSVPLLYLSLSVLNLLSFHNYMPLRIKGFMIVACEDQTGQFRTVLAHGRLIHKSSSVTSTMEPPPQTADFSQIWPVLKFGVHKLMDSPEKISATEYANLSVTAYHLAMRSRSCAMGKKHFQMSCASLNLCADLQKNLMETFIERVQLIANVIYLFLLFLLFWKCLASG